MTGGSLDEDGCLLFLDCRLVIVIHVITSSSSFNTQQRPEETAIIPGRDNHTLLIHQTPPHSSHSSHSNLSPLMSLSLRHHHRRCWSFQMEGNYCNGWTVLIVVVVLTSSLSPTKHDARDSSAS